jgi:reverse transcriptase-like protein
MALSSLAVVGTKNCHPSLYHSVSKQCSVDQAVFHKSDKHKKELTIVAVHMDDFTIAASSAHLVEDFKASLCRHIEVTDLGALHWMLGIEIRCDWEAGTVYLLQHVYINSILCCYYLADLKPLSTPMDTSTQLTIEQVPTSVAEHAIMCDMLYCEAIGTLNWAALATHPNIAFAVTTVACFAANPGPAH